MIVYESEHVWHLIMYIIHDSESYVLLIHDNVYIYIYIWRIPISFSLQWQGLPFFAFVCVRTECVPPKIRGAGCQKHEMVLGMMAAEPETSTNH